MENNFILLVEDNPDDQELVKMALSDSHIANNLVILDDGVQALEYLLGKDDGQGQDLAPLPNLIMLDLKLPKINGFDVLERLRANPRTALLPIVILTTSSEQEDMIKSYQLHANSYIRKPVDFDQFAKTIKQIGLYWMIMNETPPL